MNTSPGWKRLMSTGVNWEWYSKTSKSSDSAPPPPISRRWAQPSIPSPSWSR
jgi:hypothetical protein